MNTFQERELISDYDAYDNRQILNSWHKTNNEVNWFPDSYVICLKMNCGC